MTPGQRLTMVCSGAVFVVEEVNRDGTRAIVRGVRTGGRLMAYESPSGPGGSPYFHGRIVDDNGRPGRSLFASLTPRGQRHVMEETPCN